MRRREFITLLGGAVAARPLAARAQQPERMRHIGVLMGYGETDPAAQAQVAALRRELQTLGWDEGRNIRIDVRFPAADAGRVRAILMELISLAPDVLVSNSNLVTAVVQAEVRTTPIVFISIGDPVESGFVSNEARPNSNLTGFANWEMSMSGKWLGCSRRSRPRSNASGSWCIPRRSAVLGSSKLLKRWPLRSTSSQCSLQTCRCNTQRSSSSWSISRPLKHSASPSRNRSCCAPTR